MKNGQWTNMVLRLLMTMLIVIGPASNASAQTVRDTIETDCYLKFNLSVNRRNFLLLAIPNLYSIARGNRKYLGESFGRSYFAPDGKYRFEEQLHTGNVTQDNSVFPRIFPFVMPTPYREEIFDDLIISPFNDKNRRLYRYTTHEQGDSLFVMFRPRVRNCLLTRGSAIVNRRTNKIIWANLNGEFDYVKYDLDVSMDTVRNIPRDCRLNSGFKFLWNNIQTHIHAHYDDDKVLPDTVRDDNRNQLMAAVRRDSLTEEEKEVYVENVDTTTHEPDKPKFYEKAWSAIDDYLISSLRIGDSQTYFSLSPIIDFGGLSYSSSSGVSYRFNLNGVIRLTPNKFLSTNPYIGHNFKLDEWLFRVPLRFTYNKIHDDFLELYFDKGNKISDSRILDELKDVHRRDTIDFENLELEYFRDCQWSLNINQHIGKYFHVNLATVYHHRKAINQAYRQKMGEPTAYDSFAAAFTLSYKPSRNAAYVLNYERGFRGVLGSDMLYGRIEADAQIAKRFSALSSLNLRLGAGGYTQSSTIFFVDYVNFAQNYLPEAWDEWKGTFFLLGSDLYNASKFYIRANVSYESPIMAVARIPFVGYYIEKECLYLNIAQLQHTPTYFELGYGLATRFASFGVFASTFGGHFHEVGTKITFDLFKRW